LEALEGRVTGCVEEGEQIRVRVIPLADLWRTAPDAKSLAAVLLYEKLTAAKEL